MGLPSADLAGLAASLGAGCWCLAGPSGEGRGGATGSYVHLDADPAAGVGAMLASVHPEDQAVFLAAAEAAAREGAWLRMAFRTAHQPARFLRIAASVAWRGEGRLVLTAGVLLDETAQVMAQARLAQVVETTPALLWIMEPNGFCSFFSKSWCDYTGQTAEQALGLGWLQKVHPEDIQMAADCAARAARLKTHFHIEHRLRHRDGGWRWVLCVGNPRFGPDGEFLGHSGAVTDIHERKMWEHRIRSRQAAAMNDAGGGAEGAGRG